MQTCLRGFLPLLAALVALVSASAAPVIAIVNATYGAAGHTADVSGVLAKLVAARKFDIDVSNEFLGTDPASGIEKRLDLLYTLNGVSKMLSVNEGDAFSLLTGAISSGAVAKALMFGAPVSPEVLAALKPRIVPVRYACDDYVVASVVITSPPFGAKPDGSQDCTAIVQSAIDAVAQSGGGVVFLPSGRYRFDGSLTLRSNVTLRGDWKAPGTSAQSRLVAGTILMPTGGRGQADGAAFVTMAAGTSLRNLAIWYPDQRADAVVAYPWTVRTHYHTGMDCYTIENVTLVNPYQGLRFGPEDTELSTVRNVYGTPLKTGYLMDYSSDSTRTVNVHFSPEYWLNSGLGPVPDRRLLKKYICGNGTGFELLRSDGHDFENVSISGYHVGIHAQKGKYGTPYGALDNVMATGGDVGFLVESANTGWQLTRCSFEGETAGIWATKSLAQPLQINDCRLTGHSAIRSDGFASIQAQNCVFDGNVAMNCEGSATLLSCRLVGAGSRVKLGSRVRRALIVGGIPASAVVSHSLGDVQIDPASFTSVMPLPVPALPPDPRPAKPLLFDVAAYGACADGLNESETDNTAAFQKALDAAGRAGGGTVYVRAGLYKFAGSLLVPSGVELRGCYDCPHHTQNKGTVLLPIGGRGNAAGAPFIRLAAGSGVRGLTIYYPQQWVDGVVAYPWTFQSLGPRCYLLDIAAGNPYQLADFGSHPSEGHLLRSVMAGTLCKGFWVSKGSGVVDGCSFSAHHWLRQFSGAPCPTVVAAAKISKAAWDGLGDYFDNYLEGMVFGDCPNELQVNNAVIPDRHGLRFVADRGGACGGWVINHESDWSSVGLQIDAASPSGLQFFNTMLAIYGPVPERYALQIAKGCSGTVALFNGLTWGTNTRPSVQLLGSGHTVLQNWHMSLSGIEAAHGSVSLTGIECAQEPKDCVQISAPVKRLVLIGDMAQTGQFHYGAIGPVIVRDNSRDVAPMPPIPLVDRFATGFEPGQPSPPADLHAGLEAMNKTTCQIVPGKGRRSSNGLVLWASPQIGAENSAALYEIFLPTALTIKANTVFRFWTRPETPLGRNCAAELVFTDGTNLRDLGARDQNGLSTHPRAVRGQVGDWYLTDSEIGSAAPGKTVKSIYFIFDAGKPTGEAVVDLDDIEIGEPAAQLE